MATALKRDLIDSPRFASLARTAYDRGAGSLPEKCPTCNVHYAVLIEVMEDAGAAVRLLRERLQKECPDHQASRYNIDLQENRIEECE